MALPFFFHPDLPQKEEAIILGEETSKHVISVLRMQSGESLMLTDGLGRLAEAVIFGDHRKRCEVRIARLDKSERPLRQVTLAVSPLRNPGRFEWLLEKATEIGISRIVPLVSARTSKVNLRMDRCISILTSAMLQSQQSWLPIMDEPFPFQSFIKDSSIKEGAKLIAHCEVGEKRSLAYIAHDLPENRTILIGPEGDFTPDEIDFAIQAGFIPVDIGPRRLRTETAALVASVHLME